MFYANFIFQTRSSSGGETTYSANKITLSGTPSQSGTVTLRFTYYDDPYDPDWGTDVFLKLLITSQEDKKVTTISVTSAGNATTVVAGNTLQMSAVVTPDDATEKAVKWSVSDTSKATIDETTGLLTSVAAGPVTVTATAKDGSGITGIKEITVTAADASDAIDFGDLHVGSILHPGDKILLPTHSDCGVNRGELKFGYHMSNPTHGEVYIVPEVNDATNGTAWKVTKINADSPGSECFKLWTEGCVEEKKVTNISVTSAGDAITVAAGSTLQMSAIVTPTDATDPTVIWSVSDGTMAWISTTGLLTGVEAGTVTVTAIANDGSGIEGSKEITVEAQTLVRPTSGTCTFSNLTSDLNIQTKLTGSITIACDAHITNYKYINGVLQDEFGTDYESGEDFIINESTLETYEVKYAVEGDAIYTYFTTNADKKVTSIAVKGAGDAATVAAGSTLQMSATVIPDDAADKSVTWSVSDGTKATINTAGLLTGVAAGTVTVTATAKDGSGITGTKVITVEAAVAADRTIPLDFNELTQLKKTDGTTAVAMDGNGVYACPEEGWSWYSQDFGGYKANTLVLDGFNMNFTGSNETALAVPDGTTITGNGDITCNGSGNYAISAGESADIKIADAQLNIDNNDGITAVFANNIVCKNSDIVISGNTYACMYSNSNVTIDGGHVQLNSDFMGIVGKTTLKSGILDVRASWVGLLGDVTVLSGTLTAFSVDAWAMDLDYQLTFPGATIMAGDSKYDNVVVTSYDGEQWIRVHKEAPTVTAEITTQGKINGVKNQALSADTKLMIQMNADAELTSPVSNDLFEINCPAGISKEITDLGAGQVQIKFTGTPTEISTEDVTVTLKAGAIKNVSEDVVATGTLQWDIAAAATLEDIGNTTVSGLELPYTGENPDTDITITLDQTCSYDVSEIQWMNYNNGNPVLVEAGEKFVEGGVYFASFDITLKDGYLFKHDVHDIYGGDLNLPTGWTINGEPQLSSGNTKMSIVAFATATARPNKQVATISVTSAGTAATVSVGSTLQMSATVTPDDAADKSVTWTVSDTTKATISATGLLTGVAAGTVTVTATAKDGSGITGTKVITVEASNPVTIPNYIWEQVTLDNIDTFTEDTFIQNLTVAQAKAIVAQENIAFNNTTLVMFAQNGTSGYECLYYSSAGVCDSSTSTITSTEFKNHPTAYDVYIIKYKQTTPTAEITTQGKISGVKDQALSADTKLMIQMSADAELTSPISNDLFEINCPAGISKEITDLGAGQVQIKLTGTPTEISTEDVTVTLKAGAIKNVSEDVVATGTLQWNIASAIPGKPVTAISITSAGNTATLAIGSILQMLAEVTPTDAADSAVVWSVSDTSKATIDAATGLLTGVAAGTVTVTATAKDGSGITGTQVILVYQSAINGGGSGSGTGSSSGGGSGSSSSGSGSSSDSTSVSAHWSENSTNWTYTKSDGSLARDEWQLLNYNGQMKWYHFGSDTKMDTGWLKDSAGSWYYLNAASDGQKGAMTTGWMTDPMDGKRYYLDPATGKMATGWVTIEGVEYYFNETVNQYSGWHQDAATGEWIYDAKDITPLGAMIAGKQK